MLKTYAQKVYSQTFYTTENGEKVRSKSELTIVNKLSIRGIKYRYEEPHYLKGFGLVYPYFTILNAKTREGIIWEHFGLMDNPEYVENCLKKNADLCIQQSISGTWSYCHL